MGVTDKATAGKKPWRYYYVMTFPLRSSSCISQEKVQEMTDMTTAIEEQEEKYLRKVASRNAAHAASIEAERKAERDKGKLTLASHVAWVLRRLHLLAILLLLTVSGVFYALYSSHEAHQDMPKHLVQAICGYVVVVLVVNVGGCVSAYRCSIIGARVLLVVELGLFVGMAILLDEVNIVHSSQAKLQQALGEGKRGPNKDDMDFIINGGAVPSLVQRFIYDALSAFLLWLRAHCANPVTAKHGYASVAIDRHEFFSPLWSHTEKPCVVATLNTCLRIGAIIQPVIIGGLVVTILQVLFTGVFLAVSSMTVKAFKRRGKQRRYISRATSRFSSWSSSTLITTQLFRLVTFGTAFSGLSNVITSTDLLYFCSIADFETLFTRVLLVGLASGLSALFATLLAVCHGKEQLASLLLVMAAAFEVFMITEFSKMAVKLIGPGTTAGNDQDRIKLLGEVYSKASGQTCSTIKSWISHGCVDTSPIKSPLMYDRSCEHEFEALLIVTFNFTESFLAWSIGVKLLLLVQLILPTLRQAFVVVVSYLCCISSRDEVVVSGTETSLKQPSLNFDDAVELYLASMQSRKSTRRDTEREAFEKEWSIRTGRVLADVRTPNVVVTASDFDAIVRTLMLRRLTEVCKLDVSLSVVNNGKLLVVRIFASDNLLLATLCETETYRLQFADAIDPGRQFWHKKEVNADQKVLDASTVKYKLKLLQKENVMPPKEAVWLPGESLIRVSSRVHALTRLSRASKGLLRPCNLAPPFASYSPKIQRQFLYKKYSNRLDIPNTYRRSAVLRTVDCIRLTRRIIDMEFDMHAAISSGLVTSFHCLHSSSRFDWNSRETLASAWITFWRPVYLPGEYWPDEHALLNLLGRVAPFRQPLQSVRDYFGELVAFYFAWVAFYAKMLILPASAAIAVLAIQGDQSMTNTLWYFYISPRQKSSLYAGETDVSSDSDKLWATISPSELTLGLVVIAWGFVFAKLWERKSVWYQLEWGVNVSDTTTVSSTDEPRYSSNQHGLHKTSACLELPCLQRRAGSWLCVLVLGSINLLVVLTILLAQGEVAGFVGERLAVLCSCICQAFLMQWNGAVISWVAHTLVTWENPHHSRDNPAYRRSVISKIFALQLFNTYTGLLLLCLSDWRVLALLVHWVVPLRPLYDAYNSNIEGRISIFIVMGTLLITIFIVRVSSHLFIIVYTTSRSSAKRWTEQYYPKGKQDDETLLSTYSGPHEDYAETIMQFGLVVMFSGVCPLVPLLALVACSVKIRSDAVELCYVKQRPEPEGASTYGGEDDDVGLGLWAPCVLFMAKISVPVALALAFFTADNYDNTSLERRIGWWLIGVLCIWLLAQLFRVLVPRETRLAEEVRARNIFLVERYFGHSEAEVVDQKDLSKEEDHNKHVEIEKISLQETLPSAEQSLRHYEERLVLLHRLNVALRKRSELGMPFPLNVSEFSMHTRKQAVEEDAKGGREVEEHQVVQSDQRKPQGVERPLAPFTDDEALHRESDDNEKMIVGYFRPIPDRLPHQEHRNEEVEGKEVPSATTIEPIDIPPRQRSPLSMLFGATHPSNTETGNILASTPQPTETARGGSSSEAEGDAVVLARPTPMSKLFKRIPSSDAASSDYVDVQALLPTPISPHIPRDDHMLPHVDTSQKRWALKVSGSDDSRSSRTGTDDIPSVPGQPVPRPLPKLLQRVQHPTSSPPPTPIFAEISSLTRTEIEDRMISPVASLRDQFGFLSDARSETTATQASLATQSQRSRRRRASPPAYTRVELAGLEAVREAASRRHFDFSADDQTWKGGT